MVVGVGGGGDVEGEFLVEGEGGVADGDGEVDGDLGAVGFVEDVGEELATDAVLLVGGEDGEVDDADVMGGVVEVEAAGRVAGDLDDEAEGVGEVALVVGELEVVLLAEETVAFVGEEVAESGFEFADGEGEFLDEGVVVVGLRAEGDFGELPHVSCGRGRGR